MVGEATEQPPTARSAVSRTDKCGLTAEPAWDAEAAGAVRNTVRHPSGQPLGGDGPEHLGELAVPCQPVSVQQHPTSSVRCEVQCPRVRCPRDRCPCPVSCGGRPGVRVSAFVRCRRPASGVRCPVSSWRPASKIGRLAIRVPRLLCPNRVSSSRAGMREQPHREDGRGRRRPRRYPRPAGRLPESEPGARGWRRPCWANGGIGLAVVVGDPRPAARLDCLADQGGSRVGQGPLVGREPGTRRGSPICGMVAAGRQGHDRRHEADHDLGRWWPAPGGP